MKMPEQIRRFRGVNIHLLDITATWFDGYGVAVLEVTWQWMGKVCTTAYNRELFKIHLSVDRYNGCEKLLLAVSLLFFSKSFTLKVLKDGPQDCLWCGDTCNTKEFYDTEGRPFCSPGCRKSQLILDE